MKTVQIGQHKVVGPSRADLLEAKRLFITALSQWSLLLFSTGDLVASEEGWETLGKLIALFPVEDAGTRVSMSELEGDIEAIERLFLSGVSPSPDSIIYGNEGGKLAPAPTEKIVQNYASPALLDLCCFPLWQILPQALSYSGMTPPETEAK